MFQRRGKPKNKTYHTNKIVSAVYNVKVKIDKVSIRYIIEEMNLNSDVINTFFIWSIEFQISIEYQIGF